LCQFACANLKSDDINSNVDVTDNSTTEKLVQDKSIDPPLTPPMRGISNPEEMGILLAAEQGDVYLSLLKNKRVGLAVNHTSMVKDVHLVDYLLQNEIEITSLFTPEHGFKGNADAGEKVYNDVYKEIPIVSLYGENKKPTAEQLKGIDVLVFDMQDVGARFYTYISTMHYLMEAAAENNVELMVLDRPNPNGHYVDGPIREEAYKSFIGMHPIPIVHGMTVGELAQMINAEGWLANGVQCELKVITVANYTHLKPYTLTIKPSPNLPNQRSIYLYPSLCLFEGTEMSIGRGTQMQFQIIGHPDLPVKDFTFTPVSSPGAKYPKHENKVCQGINLSTVKEADLYETQRGINLYWITNCYNQFPDKANFFLENGFFDKLAGTKALREQIIAGMDVQTIRASWQPELDLFKEKRKKYLLYPDFE